jgi:WD40 repeat protein
VYSVSFTPDCQTLASGSYDRMLRLWDLTRDKPGTRNTIKPEPPFEIYTLAFAPDGKKLAVGGNHTTVRQYDTAKATGLRPLPGQPGAVGTVAYSPDGHQLLVSAGPSVILWDAISGKELHRYSHEKPVNCLAFSADGRYALSGSGTYLLDKNGQYVLKNGAYLYTDCVLRLWDAENGKELACDKSHTVPLYSVAIAPDCRRAFSGAAEAVFKPWELGEDGLKPGAAALKGTSGYVLAAVFSPDGRTLVTRGLDGKVIQWDLESGKRLHEWGFHENLGCVAVAADGRHLAVSLATGVVYVLRLGPAAPKS